MTASLATTQTTISSSPRRWLKPALWATMGAMTLSVLFYSEIPMLRKADERAYLSTIPYLIIPHVLAGVVALLCGPLQFSSRVRRRAPAFHRVLGRVYIVSVFIAAPLAILMSNTHREYHDLYFVAAIVVQAGTWMVVTAAAFLMARNRHFQQHREWMIRSYAVTFTFVGTRVLQPIPAWNRFSAPGFAMAIVVITLMAILIPTIALHWRDLTTRRA
jgi:uncharacterized membrane protein